MAEIGEPVRKVEYWPMEEPVPHKRTREEPTRVIPERTRKPVREPQREKEPVPV